MKSRTKKPLIIGLIVVFLVMAGAVAAKMLFQTPKITYITAPVARMDLEESVLATGIMKAFKTVEVGAQVNGQLKNLHFELGDKVKKGQLLAEIDPVLAQNTLRDAEAQVENLKAQKRSKQALLKQYESDYQRQREMNAKDAASRADLESAQAQEGTTRYDISALDAQIKQAIIAVDTAKANLGYTQIHAPIDGTIISIDTEEGQTVVSSQTATTILTLATLDTMTVKAKISEADVTRVTLGLPTYFTLLGDSETRYYGTLRAIEPGPVSSSGISTTESSSSSSSAIYYYGLFEVDNPDNKFKVSMTAQVGIVLNQAKDALCIPTSAIVSKPMDGKAIVRVLTGEQVETRTIDTGISNNIQIQVLDGLSEGEKIIIGDSSEVSEADSNNPPPRPGRR
ncbi:MAG: efflux RND transporter periplasmic adaptor subunit [Desulfobulbus oligotrophicus]|jgi:macrolide-specific efflux system membrane fusion protein|nr:efflux RND transporter periplasmic adaptor subunit [Desulfobulbus oligotrophicus]